MTLVWLILVNYLCTLEKKSFFSYYWMEYSIDSVS